MPPPTITLHRDNGDLPGHLAQDRADALFELVEYLQGASASGDELRSILGQAQETIRTMRAAGNDGID